MLIIEIAKKKKTKKLTGGHIGIMLIIKIAKKEFTGDHIKILLIIEIAKLEITVVHIGIMLIIEITKIEITGGYIGIMLIIEITKIELTGGHIRIMPVIEITKLDLTGYLFGIMLFSNIAPATLLSSISYYNKPQHLFNSFTVSKIYLYTMGYVFGVGFSDHAPAYFSFLTFHNNCYLFSPSQIFYL